MTFNGWECLTAIRHGPDTTSWCVLTGRRNLCGKSLCWVGSREDAPWLVCVLCTAGAPSSRAAGPRLTTERQTRACWEALTSSGRKEFSDCYTSKPQSWKRTAPSKAASEVSRSPFPLVHRFLSTAGEGVYFLEVWKKEQKQLRPRKPELLTCNPESVHFTVKPRRHPQPEPRWRARRGALQGCSPRVCWCDLALKSPEARSALIAFWCVWIPACLPECSYRMKRSRWDVLSLVGASFN